MLSLSPRFDLFRFYIPKDYIPENIRDKYDHILSKNAGVLTNSVDYLNESIQGVSIPGISDIIHEQPQISHNPIHVSDRGAAGLGRINIEPHHTNHTYSSENPIFKIGNECTIKFRQNQGLYNYWMLYETILERYVKHELYENSFELFEHVILNEDGVPVVRIKLSQPKFSGLDGLEFNYSKVERESDTFDANFVYNNIDIEFCAK